MEQYGWQVDRETGIVTPLWFRMTQFPQSVKLRISQNDIRIEPAAKQPRLDDLDDITMDCENNARNSLIEDTFDIEK